MRKNLVLLTMIGTLLFGTSCESEMPGFPGSSIEIDKDYINLSVSDSCRNTFTFTASGNWTISLADTTQSGWLKVSPMSGQGGDVELTIISDPNNIDDRSTVFVIDAQGTKVAVNVSQEFGKGITDINIPDRYFREYCLSYFDADGDGKLSYTEVKDVTSLSIGFNSIKSLEGIEYFRKLSSLDCMYNVIKDLDLSKNSMLTSLDCRDNSLTTLNLAANTNLETLYCSYNLLKEIDLSNNVALTLLDCSYNSLKTIDVSKNTKLKALKCTDNQMETLDISNNTSLEELYCQYNNLTSLDFSKNTELVYINCIKNQLTTLNIYKCEKLRGLSCYYNPNLAEVLVNSDQYRNRYMINRDSHTEIVETLVFVLDR